MEQMTLTVPVFTLGDRLRKAREIIGLTQAEMANSLGIGRRSVSRYEDGEQEPKRGIVMAWAMATGVAFEWLSEGKAPAVEQSALNLTPKLTNDECYSGLLTRTMEVMASAA